jgi:cytochrome c
MLELCSTPLSSSAGSAKSADAQSVRRPRRAIFRAAIRCALPLFLLVLGPFLTTASAQSAADNPNATPASAAANRKAALINSGRIVFNQRCEICHFIDSNAQKIGPGLKGLFARTRLADGTRITESTVANVVSEGGKDMPGYQDLLKPGQIQALIAYLKSR